MTKENMTTTFFELAKSQGLPFILLCVAVWWFNNKVEQLEKKQDICSQQLIEIYENDHKQMIKIIERNTETINKFLNE
jgi:hypothetical protein